MTLEAKKMKKRIKIFENYEGLVENIHYNHNKQIIIIHIASVF